MTRAKRRPSALPKRTGVSSRKRTLPEPRSWLTPETPRRRFGTNKLAAFQQPKGRTERALVSAAIAQHEFARSVRAELRRSGVSTTTVAAQTGLTIDQLRRILRGEVHLTLSDMHLIQAYTLKPASDMDAGDA